MMTGFIIGLVIGFGAFWLLGAWSFGKWIVLAKWLNRKGKRT